MQSLKILEATYGSTAERGSSSNIISASEYRALARLILALYPPEIFTPLSPIIVSIPFPKSVISLSKQECFIASFSLFSSSYFPKRILFFTESEIMNGSCST